MAPEPCWSIVTSARFKYASAALPTAAVPPHHHLVTANDVQNGKPNPEPYLKGAAKLGVDTKNCEYSQCLSLLVTIRQISSPLVPCRSDTGLAARSRSRLLRAFVRLSASWVQKREAVSSPRSRLGSVGLARPQ